VKHAKSDAKSATLDAGTTCRSISVGAILEAEAAVLPQCNGRLTTRLPLSSSMFAFGMVTHYALDVLLIHVSGGMALLYPLSWETWALQLVRPDNWLGTTILVVAALLVYGALKIRSDRRSRGALAG
jgi:hypothetical protein